MANAVKVSDELDRRFPEGTLAQAICTQSVLVRGVFTAYSWVKLLACGVRPNSKVGGAVWAE